MSEIIKEVTDLTHPHALRRSVFMDEQGVSYDEEFDDLDDVAIHLLATIDGEAVGTTRLLVEGSIGKIGRVCVAKNARGIGLGHRLIDASIERLKAIDGITELRLGAQCHAIGFYQAHGFRAYGEEYDDAGIPHRWMKRAI